MSENRIHHEETIKSETIYDGRIIKVRVDTVELSNMSYSKREIVEHQRAVSLVAITENQEIYLVKQYRKAVDKVIYEIPAGLVDGNESLQDAAKREAQEEIGMKPNNLELLVESYSSPGFTDEIFSVFLANLFVKSALALKSLNSVPKLLPESRKYIWAHMSYGLFATGVPVIIIFFINNGDNSKKSFDNCESGFFSFADSSIIIPTFLVFRKSLNTLIS